MTHDLFLNNTWQQGLGSRFESICPATGTIVGTYHAADEAQVQQAIKSARVAFNTWSLIDSSERISILRTYAQSIKQRREAIARAISQDMGKPLWESLTEADAMAGKVDISIQAMNERTGEYTKDAPFGSLSLTHRPHGVMAVFGPFNFPGHLPNGHIVPALLAGNTCVFKPSELAPAVSKLMAEAFMEAGLPDGVLNIVQGGRDTGEALLNSDVNGVLFTGSVGTGVAFHRHFAGRPDVILALEMGGNNPLIVHKADNVDATAETIFQSSFITSGQRCTCARRLILPSGKFGDDVLDAVMTKIETTKIGKWDEQDTYLGPVVSERAARSALDFEKTLIDLGGRSLKPLHTVDGTGFVHPGIIDMTSVNSDIDDELFGPLLQVYRVDQLEKAVDMANSTRFGLSAGVITDDEATWDYAQKRLRVGILNRNRPTTGASSAMPFGGPGLSGNARPSAYYAADYCAWPQARQLG